MVQNLPIRSILKKIRNYEIRMQKQLTHLMQGDYRSVFKGSGLTFDDVRPYQYGDEVRAINWKLSAKGQGMHVNTFKEEREQTVFFLLDVSGSQEVGLPAQRKVDVGKELCGVLAFSAVRYGAQVGLMGFSDRKELMLRPGKGARKAYEIVHVLYALQPRSLATDLGAFLRTAAQVIKKKSLLIFLSDFIGNNYKKPLAFLGSRHDVIAIDLVDKRERHFPRLGMLPLVDRERGHGYWLNTSSRGFRQAMQQELLAEKEDLKVYCRRHKVHYLQISTQTDYVPQLVELFKRRNKRGLR